MKNTKKADLEKLKKEAVEIRKMIIQRASNDGGHIASPLGAVEIIQSLIQVFDFSKDKIVFDIGHQAHAYKILTGRKNIFYSMSKKGGMRAYPDITESKFDFYGVGHSATGVSAALGYSVDHPEYKSIAVIGDGSLTGGEVFESLNHAGALKTNLLVILNDNGFSFDENIGALHNKKNVKKFAESLGFEYIGLIDGHDTKALIEILESTIEKKYPIFIHVVTKKGKGYEPAEINTGAFHWVSPFDLATGKPKNPFSGDNAFAHLGAKGIEYIKKYQKVYFVAPSTIKWGLSAIKSSFPKHVIDTGINEQHCVTFSSALALNGNKVFCNVSSMFMARPFDQVIDVCIQKIPMIFTMCFGGIGDGGYTHQSIYTLSLLNMLPNATIMHPCNFAEFDRLLDVALTIKGPVFVQVPGENIVLDTKINSDVTQVRRGSKLTILPIGHMMNKAIKLAEKLGDVEVLYVPVLKPFNAKELSSYVSKTSKLLILEDGFVRGGMGEGIINDLHDMGLKFDYSILGVRDIFPEQGSMAEVYEYVGLDDASIEKAARN